MATFKAFKPEAMQRIARSMGHMGDMNQFENFLMANPDTVSYTHLRAHET